MLLTGSFFEGEKKVHRGIVGATVGATGAPMIVRIIKHV